MNAQDLTFSPAIHPGEILREEFLEPLGLSAGKLARRIEVPRTRIERLIKEDAPVTPDTALRLARAFGTSAQFWLNMQSSYDLAVAAEKIDEDLKRISPVEGLGNSRAA